MTTGKTFDDYDLSVRAERAVKNCGYQTPAAFIKSFNENYDSASAEFLRMPGCGRGTLNELLEALEVERPQSSKVRLAKFMNWEELLRFMATDPDMALDPTKLDANTLRLLLDLIGLDHVVKDAAGLYHLSTHGDAVIDSWKMTARCSMTIIGPRAVLMDLIRALPDDYPYMSVLEEELMRDIDQSDKAIIELGS